MLLLTGSKVLYRVGTENVDDDWYRDDVDGAAVVWYQELLLLFVQRTFCWLAKRRYREVVDC